MLQKQILLVLFIVSSLKSFSQERPLKVIPFNIDEKIVKVYSDSLRRNNTDTIFIYLTVEEKSDYTYLIWVKNNKSRIVRISENSVSKPLALNLNFYRNVNFYKLAISENENKLKMIPPLSHKKYCEIFIFESKKAKFLIESGNSTGFVLDTTKNNLRKQFIVQLKQDLNLSCLNWEEEKKYIRYNQ